MPPRRAEARYGQTVNERRPLILRKQRQSSAYDADRRSFPNSSLATSFLVVLNSRRFARPRAAHIRKPSASSQAPVDFQRQQVVGAGATEIDRRHGFAFGGGEFGETVA